MNRAPMRAKVAMLAAALAFCTATPAPAAANAAAADGRAAAFARELEQAGLDPDACFRVRDVAFQKEDLRFYLTEGQLIFSKPVAGRRFAAMFTADIPGGDAEVLLFPPTRSERASLAQFAKTPNLNEHFRAALFLFSDGTGEELLKQVEESMQKRLPEIGSALASSFNGTLRNLARSYEVRLVQDHFSSRPAETGFFYAALSGKTLGNIDMVFDRRQRDEICVGQLVFRNDRRYWDTWTAFPSRSTRTGARRPSGSAMKLEKVRIDATLAPPDLRLKAVSTHELVAQRDGDTAIAFEVSRRVRIAGAKVDGEPVELFDVESLRANLIRATNAENNVVLVMLPKAARAGERHVLEFTLDGDVVTSAGNGVYFVASRLSWYPTRDAEFATYDLSFRHPKNLRLVATGEPAGEALEGDMRVVRFHTPQPIRFAGFNLGEYQTSRAVRGGVTLEVCANRNVEAALAPKAPVIDVPPPPGPRQRRNGIPLPQTSMGPPSPTSRLDQLTSEIGGALEFMTAHFGPPATRHLAVSPIPGAFGQGFPGLLYLSTLAYLNPADRPPALQTEAQRIFFSELLHAHETAHQWWGNLVITDSYQDDWLMEALANYSALLLLEQRKGRKALDSVLEEYRQNLLKHPPEAQAATVESAGPLSWGSRLNSSFAAGAWRSIIYDKGAWVLHMLRERMGEERFLAMLGEVAKRKRYAALTTEEFRQIAAEFLPPKSEDPKLEAFFDSWVYNTGIPVLKVNYQVTGKAPRVQLKGTVTQSDVGDEFTAAVPIDIQLPGRKAIRHWVKTASEATTFSIDLPAVPVKINADPLPSVLARK